MYNIQNSLISVTFAVDSGQYYAGIYDADCDWWMWFGWAVIESDWAADCGPNCGPRRPLADFNLCRPLLQTVGHSYTVSYTVVILFGLLLNFIYVNCDDVIGRLTHFKKTVQAFHSTKMGASTDWATVP